MTIRSAVLSWALAQPVGSAPRTLAEAVVSGATTVRDADGRVVTYRTQAELAAALDGLWEAGPGGGSLTGRPARTTWRIAGDGGW